MLRWMNLKGTPLYSVNTLYGVTPCKISIPLQPTPSYQLGVLQCSRSAKNVFRGSQFHWSVSVLCFYMQICISGHKRLFSYCWSSPESYHLLLPLTLRVACCGPVCLTILNLLLFCSFWVQIKSQGQVRGVSGMWFQWLTAHICFKDSYCQLGEKVAYRSDAIAEEMRWLSGDLPACMPTAACCSS